MVFLGGHSEIRTGHANAVNPVSNKTIMDCQVVKQGAYDSTYNAIMQKLV